jgi:RND family efflux transporter MFP subunit
MHPKILVSIIPAALLLAALGWLGYTLLQDSDNVVGKRKDLAMRAVPVEVAPIQQRPITLRRSFTGTLEARADFVISPKIDGRLVKLEADLGDRVSRGQIVARLDDAEYRQDVARAEADLAVAHANLQEARSQLVIAERELARIEKLSKRGVSSVSQRDVAKADQLAKQAHVQVTQAQLSRAEAELESARIRLGYTQVKAVWQQGNDTRVVAERFLDEGETVSTNAPLLRIVELNPITAVFYATERDYALLQTGQRVEISTDAYPDKIFNGRIDRIAPVFREDTRQARVEVSVDNPATELKPGMYARASVVLASVPSATVVPHQALVTRERKKGVFVVSPDDKHVTWHPVTVGIQDDDMLQISGDNLSGRVVTLGQQLLDDGSRVTLAGNNGVAE